MSGRSILDIWVEGWEFQELGQGPLFDPDGPPWNCNGTAPVVAVVQSLSRVQLFAIPWTKLLRLPLSPGACSASSPLSRWCHPTISSSAIHFSFWLQSFPESGSFPMSQHFPSDGQSIRASASTTFFPMNNQGWFPLGLKLAWSPYSPRDSQVFSSTTIWKHQFFRAQPSLRSNSHICTSLLEKQ